jgi:hypothetical protein
MRLTEMASSRRCTGVVGRLGVAGREEQEPVPVQEEGEERRGELLGLNSILQL